MALTLAAALAAPTASAPALSLEVSGTVPDAIDIGYRFRLGDEVLELRSFFRTTAATFGGTTTENVRDANSWEVARALAGTAAVSHDAGTAVLGVTDALVAGDDEDLPEPFATDGGGTTDHTALTNRDAADQHPVAAITGAVATRYDNFEDGPKRVTIEPSGESTTGEAIITIWTGEVVDEETVAGKLTLNANQLRGELGTVAFTLSADGSALLEAGDASVLLGADFSVSVFGTVVTVGEDILPATDNLHSLGSAELRWANVRANALFAGNTAAGPFATLGSGSLEIYDSSLGQRVAFSESDFWIADGDSLRVLEFAELVLSIRDGDAVTEFGLDHIELQDAGGAAAFRVGLGAELDIRVPLLPTADPAAAGRLYTYADNSGAGLVANLLTQIAAGARIVLQSNPA